MNHASDTVGVNAAEPTQKKKQRYPRKRKPKPQQEREGGKDDVNASTPLRVDASPFVPSMLKPKNTETSSANETSLAVALTPSASRRKRKPLSSTHSLQHLPEQKNITICPICAADDVEFVAVGHCNHPICTLCAMRLRLKFNEKDCPLCKQQIKLIAVQRCKSTNYDDSNVSSLAEVFLKYGWDQETDCRDLSPQRGLDIDLPTSMVFVDCNSHYRSMSRMRSFLCPFKKCWKGAGGGTFPSEALFLRHIQEQHPAKGGGVGSNMGKNSDGQGDERNEGASAVGGGPTLCICCLESRPLFTTEHTIFPHPRSLRKHQQADHRECGFCRDFHFDTAAMYKHMSLMHFACPLCPPRLMFRFYRDHVSLHDHLRQAHIVCRACETSATQQLRPNETMDIGAFTFSGPVEYAAHAQEYHGSRVNTAALLRGAVRDGASYQNRNRDNNRRIPHIDLEMGSANPYSASSNDDHSTDLAGITAPSFRSTGLSSSVRDPRARGSSSSSSSNAGMGSRNNPLSFISPNMQIVGRVTGSGRFSGRLTDSDLELQAAADRQAAAMVAQVRQMNMQHESAGTSRERGGERANGRGERNGACVQARLEAQFPSLSTSHSTPPIAPSFTADSSSSGAVAVESSSSAWGSSGGSSTTAFASPALHPLSVIRNRAHSSSAAPSDGGSVSVHGSRMQRSAMLADAFFGSAGAPVGDLGIACRGAGTREATSAAMTHSSGSGNTTSSARAAFSSSVAEEFELALWVLSTTAMITPPSAPLNSRVAAVAAATLIDPTPPSRFSSATFPRVRFIKTMSGLMVDDLPVVELRGVAHLFHRFLYPPTLVQWAKQNKTEILKIEKKVYDLLNDATRSSVNLKPMASSTRSLTHFLAKMYLLNSYEYDPEPRRYVSFVKTHASGSPSMLFSKELTIARPNPMQNHIASTTSITTSTGGGASGVRGIAGSAGSESSSSASGSIRGGGMREYVLSVRMNGVSLQLRSTNKLQAISVLNQQSTNNSSTSASTAWGLGGIGGDAARKRSGSAEASSMDVDADLLNYRHCTGIFSIADVVGKVVAYLLQDPFYQQEQQQQLLSEAQANPLKLQGVRLTSPSAVSFVFTDHVAAARAVTVLKQLQACVPPSPSSSLTAQLSSDGYLRVPTESLSPIAAAVLGERVASSGGGAGAAGVGRSPQQGMILSHAEVTFLQCVEFLPLFDPPSTLTQQTQQPLGQREGEVGSSGGGDWESDWREGRRRTIGRDMDGGGFSSPGHGIAFFAPTAGVAGVAGVAGAAGIGMGAGGADAWWTEDEVEGGSAGGSAVAVHEAEIWAGGDPADEEGSAPVATAFASYAMPSHHEGASGSGARGAIPGNAADTNADADTEADVSISRDRVPGGAALASLSAAQEEWEQFLQERSQMITTQAFHPAEAAAGVARRDESGSQSAASLPLPAQSTDSSISAPATPATTTAAAANRPAAYLPPWRRNLNSGSEACVDADANGGGGTYQHRSAADNQASSRRNGGEEGRTMRREMGVGVATGAGVVQRLEVALDPTPVAVPIAVPYTVENSFDDDLVAYITHQHSAADTPPPPLALTSEATGARGAGGQQQGARNRQRGQLDAVRGVRGAAAGDGTWAGGPANPFTLLQGSRGDDSSDEEVGNVHEEDEEVVVAVEEEEHEAAGEAEAAVEL